jgi:hypothetical protein
VENIAAQVVLSLYGFLDGVVCLLCEYFMLVLKPINHVSALLQMW